MIDYRQKGCLRIELDRSTNPPRAYMIEWDGTEWVDKKVKIGNQPWQVLPSYRYKHAMEIVE